MSTRQSFYFDASACSGCKACQVACKDRHGLEVGRLWRRVSEVTGGSWQQEGSAWHNNIFAYHLSVSCNHCEKAICLEGCPAQAISRRDDGIVLINAEHCLGCGYCSWVCPYSAPQYQPDRGVMTKCTLCVEDLDRGNEPACVAACPVRALDFGDFSELAQGHGFVDQPAELPPLPNPRLTEPSLVLAPHADAHRSTEPDVVLTPRPARGLREMSLVAFTLLSQMAAGLALVGGGLRVWLGPEMASVDAVLWPLTAALMALAMIVSTLHLGKPSNARRALLNLSTSWLSREILLASLFFGTTILAGLPLSSHWLSGAASWLTIPMAFAYLWGMAGVYRQRTVPVWNRASTLWSFLVSALLLGGLGLNALVWGFAHFEEGLVQSISIWLLSLCVVGVGVPWYWWLMREVRDTEGRSELGLSGAMGIAFGLGFLVLLVGGPDLMAGSLALWMSWGLLILVGADQVKQRRRYYGGYERVGV